MKTLYFDCFSGISGDMTLGALLDLGVNENILLEGLKALKLEGYEIKIEKKLKNGIMGTELTVLLDTDDVHVHTNEEHHHDHENEHTHTHEHEHEHQHGHNHNHHHDHTHDHTHEAAATAHHHGHEHSHEHRSLKDIELIIDNSSLNENVKQLSKKIFRVVAEAEGKIHGKAPEEVHFHEVGAMDSIIDIIGTAICIDALKVNRIVFSPIPLSRGFVKCQHGVFPLPAPAALEILKNVPVYYSDVSFELVTPTGAAFVKALADEYGNISEGEIKNIGYGLGKKTYEVPNVLRAVVFEAGKKKLKE